MNQTTIINGLDKRYLSEVKEFENGIPFGVVNKKLTDVGGTYCAINCKYNYIVVVPFRDLATSIEVDVNNKYPVFKLYGGVLKNSFTNYMEHNKVKKIAVTYDSLEKLINWLEGSGENLDNYKVLVDEYHLILEDLDFRDEAINKLLESITKFKHYSFLSATPINTDFEFDFFKGLPHYELDWGILTQINPTRMKTPNVYKGTVNLINEFKSGLILDTIDGKEEQVKELHIFINSVKGIAQICKSAGLENDEVRIVCADRIKNNMVLEKYTIGSISDPNASINFYTKKGFQGCNIFSNNALVVVVSDAKLAHTLVDIDSTLIQIVGRIRLNNYSQNVFRHKIYHIFSTNKEIKTEEEFEDYLITKRRESRTIYNDLITRDDEIRELYIKRMNFESDFLSIRANTVFFNERKEQLFRYKFQLKKAYKDGYSVRAKYNKSDKFLDSSQTYSPYDNIILSKIVNVTLEELYNSFLEAEDKEPYELEYPEFFEYKRYITVKEMNSARWNKDKIEKLLSDRKSMNIMHSRVSKLLDNGFISSAELKNMYLKEFSKAGLTIAAKATLIESNPLLEVKKISKRIDEKKVVGYEITKNMFNFNN